MWCKTTTVRSIVDTCSEIMHRHGAGQTEHFYSRMLQCWLYEKRIPFLTESECFTVSEGGTPVLIGRIDIEVDHHILLELKIGPKLSDKHERQLLKYVASRQGVTDAAVVCFRDDGVVQARHLKFGVQSRFFE